MKKTIRVVLFVAAIGLGVFFLWLSSYVEKHMKNEIPIELNVSDSYAITDMDELEATLVYTGTSSDRGVAVLREGKNIYAAGEGKATVTVSDGERETDYLVTVKNDPESLVEPMGSDNRTIYVPSNRTFIGYSYNAFDGNQFDALSLQKMHEVFDWETVYYSGQLTMDRHQYSLSQTFSGSSSNAFMESLSNKSSATVTVKFRRWKLYDKTWTESERRDAASAKNAYYFQDYKAVANKTFYLKDEADPYFFYLKKNVKIDLMDSSVSPEEFIRLYGTHVAVGTLVGESIETNAFYNGSKHDVSAIDFNDPDDPDLIRVIDSAYDESRFRCESFVYDYDFDETERFFTDNQWNSSNESMRPNCTVKVIANGDYNGFWRRYPCVMDNCTEDRVLYEHLIFHGITQVDGQKVGSDYYGFSSGWINDDVFYFGNRTDEEAKIMWNSQDWGTLVGPRDANSLIPFWEIIPTDTEKGQARKEEFVKYIQSLGVENP